MAQNITLLGASYSDVPAVTLPKTGGGTASFVDTTDATATADKILQGYTAYGADGSKLTGTATGSGGSVTQDQDGFIVLPPTGGSTPSGGLVYETGTWTPSEDVADYTISFANTHDSAPFYYMISDVTGTALPAYTCAGVIYSNFYSSFGEKMSAASTAGQYAKLILSYVLSDSISSAAMVITSQPSQSGGTDWASTTGIRAYCNNASRYWRSGRTYKWIAVWAPTT